MGAKKVRDKDGKTFLQRPPYDPRYFTIAPERLAQLSEAVKNWGYDEAMTDREGMFNGWLEVEKLQRDGKTWAVLYATGSETVIEVELLASGGMGEVRAVTPERAYEVAKKVDAKLYPGIPYA